MLLVFCGGGHSPVPPLLSLTAGEGELNDRSYRGTVRVLTCFVSNRLYRSSFSVFLAIHIHLSSLYPANQD